MPTAQASGAGSVPNAGNIVGNVSTTTTINHGVDPEKHAALAQELGAAKAEIELLNEKILNINNIPQKERDKTRIELDRSNKKLKTSLAGNTSSNSEAMAYIEQANTLFKNIRNLEDYQKIDALLEKAELIQQSNAHQELLNAAATRASRGDLSFSQLNYAQAAQHYKVAAEMAPDKIIEPRRRYCIYLKWHAFALYKHGSTKGNNTALSDAISAFQSIVQHLDRRKFPSEWVEVQDALGTAMSILGERQTNPKMLQEAVLVHRAALKVQTRRRDPWVWAAIQCNLAAALERLAQFKRDPNLTQQAIDAFNSALQVYTLSNNPMAWASTQHNLASTLRTLAETNKDHKKLHEVVKIYRKNLELFPRDREPLDWAMTQNSLANTLSTLGAWEENACLIEEAVAAYQNALQEYTRDRIPLEWASAQNGLGGALMHLGKLKGDSGLLQSAVGVFREALQECTRERHPHLYSEIQCNLALALATLARQLPEKSHLFIEEAEQAIKLASEVNIEVVNNRNTSMM